LEVTVKQLLIDKKKDEVYEELFGKYESYENVQNLLIEILYHLLPKGLFDNRSWKVLKKSKVFNCIGIRDKSFH